jgi:hypothetical protein
LDWDFIVDGLTNQSLNGLYRTLFTDQHFVAANHFQQSDNVAFINRDGDLKEYTISGTQFFIVDGGMGGTGEQVDLFVGKLTTAIGASDKISSYPILDRGANDLLTDSPQLIVYGKDDNRNNSPLVGLGSIDGGVYSRINVVNEGAGLAESIAYQIDDNQQNGDVRGEGGDSGGPSFILYNNTLTLAGIHSAIDTNSNPERTFDTSLAVYRTAVETLLFNDDGSTLAEVAFNGTQFYSSIAPIPEPKLAGLLIGLMVFGGIYFRRVRHRAA